VLENSKIEFKSSFTDAVIETITAFANTKGGKVYVGICDDGTFNTNFIIGKESIAKWQNDIKLKTQPSVIPDFDIEIMDGNEVLVISVSEFPVKPIAFKGRYYKRNQNSNHLLTALEIADLSIRSLQLSWDSYPSVHSWDELDEKKISRFIDRVNSSGRFRLEGSPLECLQKLKMVSNTNCITNAAYLLFAKEDIDYSIHLGRFKTESLIIDDKLIKASLFDAVEAVIKYIVAQLKVAFEITGETTQRTEIFEYPLPAIREMVLNAIVHRDYMSPIDVQIKLFDKKIVLFNPGTLYGDLTPNDLRSNNYHANARNRLIAEAFYLTGDIEKYGSGFRRIFKEIATYPTMELYCDNIPNGFEVALSYVSQKVNTKVTDKVTDRVTDRVTDHLTANQRAIIELLLKNNRQSLSELAFEIKISKRKIIDNINKLKEFEIVERIGNNKSGYWKINKVL
jgi:ATP-dependent DNA helicase RecG